MDQANLQPSQISVSYLVKMKTICLFQKLKLDYIITYYELYMHALYTLLNIGIKYRAVYYKLYRGIQTMFQC